MKTGSIEFRGAQSPVSFVTSPRLERRLRYQPGQHPGAIYTSDRRSAHQVHSDMADQQVDRRQIPSGIDQRNYHTKSRVRQSRRPQLLLFRAM